MLQETLEHQRPWVGSSNIYVFQGLWFMNLVGEKWQKHRTRLDISGSQLTVSWISATRLESQGLMLFTSHLWRNNRGKGLWAESSVVNGPWESHRARWNTSDSLFLCSISSLEFLCLRTSTWRQSRHWWCLWHLMLLMITSLCTRPWARSWLSLVIAPGSSFLGRLIWLIAAKPQRQYAMRPWCLTCRPRSKHGRMVGSGRVAIY